jgi:hypothetical protein
MAKKKNLYKFTPEDIREYFEVFCVGLFHKIKHGDKDHQEWLKDALENEKKVFLERMNLDA